MKTLNQWNIGTTVKELFMKHGLVGWRFKLDRAKKRAGCCHHHNKTISLSYFFVERNSDEEIMDTTLHEIAHAIAGFHHGHDDYWKSICIRIGAKPNRCYDSQRVEMPKGRYRAVCGGCGKMFHKHRRVRARYYCTPCGPVKGLLQFKEYAHV